MTERIQKPKPQEVVKKQPDQLTEEDVAKQKAAQAIGEAAISDMDELLDEIDGLLEVNAEEFVRNFIQKGGE